MPSRHLRRPTRLSLEDFLDTLRPLGIDGCQRVAVSQQNSTIRLQAHDPAPARLRLDIRQAHSEQYPMRLIQRQVPKQVQIFPINPGSLVSDEDLIILEPVIG